MEVNAGISFLIIQSTMRRFTSDCTHQAALKATLWLQGCAKDNSLLLLLQFSFLIALLLPRQAMFSPSQNLAWTPLHNPVGSLEESLLVRETAHQVRDVARVGDST